MPDILSQGVPSPGAPVPQDSLEADSLFEDSMQVAESWGLVLDAPAKPGRLENTSPAPDFSWAVMAVLVLTCLVCFRFRRNTRFFHYLLKELVETKARTNMFDDTVRETTFLGLLDTLGAVCGGIILSAAISLGIPEAGIPPVAGASTLAGTAVCSLAVGGYLLLLWGSYALWGRIFCPPPVTRHWIRGFSVSTGLLAILLLPVALICCVQPQWTAGAVRVALAMFILVKIAFIWKSLRIFITEISSWTVFLYYLCSLEIVPLVLTFSAALFFCGGI